MQNPTLYNIGNWLTSGTFDMIKGAVQPQKPLSLEHWLNSLGTVLLGIDLYEATGSSVARIKNAIQASKTASTSEKVMEAVDDTADAAKAAAKHTDKLSTELTRAQKRNVASLKNVIENNLTDADFSGTLADLRGTPIAKADGGYWDHLTEMKQSYTALTKIKAGLQGSLRNPNLAPEVRTLLEDELKNADDYIKKIENLFKPFGGIKNE